ncbi:MAG TPA: hypothetical protein VMG82_39920 [Candidatus Sulfotelmatobacter sp.]|nr:hypothetical protein [Candidatus Sulfotelmatobacter sp.]
MADFRPSLRRRASVTNRLTARLFRDGFHALAVLRGGVLIGAVPGSIVTLLPGQNEFHETHAITRGTRPLHITAVPNGIVYWGEYFDNAGRDEVHIYASVDDGETWGPAYTFPKGAIRHIHNIVHDTSGAFASSIFLISTLVSVTPPLGPLRRIRAFPSLAVLLVPPAKPSACNTVNRPVIS